ncbi:Succinate-semialdehyde dehydrogenase [NAD(P)+] [hydrothermal vent metagenome]|uniref:Succinate-semialdehyde dehydrogenase [NAD(P)+] n=1 Tax=hydrothermal vent metagenome TaxID=652676 RepID=A0A3B1BIE0_9ZZZZ
MKTAQVFSPFDGHLIKELALQTDNEIEKMMATAYALTLNPDNVVPLPERLEILEKTARLVEERMDDYVLQATEEGGKPYSDSRVELVRAVQGIREAACALRELKGEEIPMGLTAPSLGRRAFTVREPIGLVVAVSAFNHPFNLIVHQVVTAVAAGCPVIVKPAIATPLSCLNLVECLYEAGLPKQWLQVAICRRDLTEKMVTDKRTAFFSFIGSAKVGWGLRSKLAPGARCALEHGGAAPVIVEADADIKEALPLLAKGGFYHAGQVCVSVQRIFVHHSIAESLADQLSTIAKKLVVGDPANPETEVGPLITRGEVDRVHEWVEEAKALGGKILTGGKKIGKTCYEPTVIYNPSPEALVSTKEIFGPVVCVYPYKERLKAIEQANDVDFSFQAAVFTQDLDVAFDTVKRLSAAAVMVNDHTAFRVDWMPFAGHKTSGLGVGGILPAMKELTKEKLIVLNLKTP